MDLNRLVTRSELLNLRQNWQHNQYKVVFTNGCFDLLHLGHVRYLEEARALGDILVLGLNSDNSVRRLKGSLRPLVSENERAEVMAGLRSVDYIVIFDEDTAENLVEALKPDIYVKGGDYSLGLPSHLAHKPLPEAKIVQSYGGKVEIIPFLPGHSTSDLIDKIVRLYS